MQPRGGRRMAKPRAHLAGSGRSTRRGRNRQPFGQSAHPTKLGTNPLQAIQPRSWICLRMRDTAVGQSLSERLSGKSTDRRCPSTSPAAVSPDGPGARARAAPSRPGDPQTDVQARPSRRPLLRGGPPLSQRLACIPLLAPQDEPRPADLRLASQCPISSATAAAAASS